MAGAASAPGAADAEARAHRQLAHVLLEHFPDEAARVLDAAAPEELAKLVEQEGPEVSAPLLGRLTPGRAGEVLASLAEEPARRLLAVLNPNRAAAWLARLEEPDRERLLGWLDEGLADELRSLASYPTDTAGALMDPRVAAFRPDARLEEVLRRLRRRRDRRVQDVFVVDGEGRLTGCVALEDIALGAPETRLESLAQDVPARVQGISSRDEVIETFESHRVASLPVVDFEDRLLGVLRQRELIRAATEEATADAVTMVGASDQERALSSPAFAIRKRLPWLQVNLLTAFLAASVVGLFEATIAKVTALAVLLPVVAGQSGNTGAQALAVTMRGLALREVRTRNWFQVAVKETLAGSGNGIAVALTTALAVFVWSRSPGLSLVIGLSMVLSMTLAGLSGAAIPMLLTALRQDPAQSSSIILTTVTDVVGFFSFLGIATLLSSML